MKIDKEYKKNSMRYFARCICEIFHNVENITIYVKGESGSFMGNKIETKYVYNPNDKNLFLIPCPNKDCGGIGFDLTSEVDNMIREEKECLKGNRICKEKESEKIGSCACLSEIEFTISIVYRSKNSD